jgi:TonB family protein
MRPVVGVVAACLLCGTAFAELEALDRASIAEGINAVKPQVIKCGETHKTKGKVKVSVRVNSDGNVTEIIVKEAPEAQLGACVAKAMEKAVFAKTKNGGSFSYPFVF